MEMKGINLATDWYRIGGRFFLDWCLWIFDGEYVESGTPFHGHLKIDMAKSESVANG